MFKVVIFLFFYFSSNLAFAIGEKNCIDLRKKDFETELALLVGKAVLYPMDKAQFDASIDCIFSSFAVAPSITWDLSHALLNIMIADPEQFFYITSQQPASRIESWINSFEHAAAWPGDVCPKLDPIAVARNSIHGLHFESIKSEALRKRVYLVLNRTKCRTAD
jgi:hypothetical protein